MVAVPQEEPHRPAYLVDVREDEAVGGTFAEFELLVFL